MSRYSREFAEVERRMRRLENQLERLSVVASRSAKSGVASAAQATDRVGETVVSALSELVDRFRGGARELSGEASRFGQEATRFGHEASKLGSDALRRMTTEVERRPLMTLGIAVGVGLLIGLGGGLGSRRR